MSGWTSRCARARIARATAAAVTAGALSVACSSHTVVPGGAPVRGTSPTIQPTSPSPLSTSLSDDFESGRVGAISSAPPVAVGRAYAREGSFGVRATDTPTQGGHLTWDHARFRYDVRYARISAWVRVDSFRSGQSVDVLTLKNAHGRNHFDFYRDPGSGRWRYDLHRGDNAYSTMRARLGRWYFVEALVDFGGHGSTVYSARVRIDGIDQPTIRSTGQVGTTVRSAWFGGTNPRHKTNTREYDSLRVDVDAAPFSFTR